MGGENVEFVKGLYAAFGRGDVPAVLAGFADDIEWHEALGMPYGGVYRGGDAVMQNVFGPIATDVEGRSYRCQVRCRVMPMGPAPQMMVVVRAGRGRGWRSARSAWRVL